MVFLRWLRRALAVGVVVVLCLIACDVINGGLSPGALLAGVATWISSSIAGEVLLYVARHTRSYVREVKLWLSTRSARLTCVELAGFC